MLSIFSATPAPAEIRTKTFQSWAVECEELSARCTLAQTASSKDDRFWLATLRLRQTVKGGAQVQVIVPSGVHLGSGLFVGVTPPYKELAYQRCSPTVCVAAGILDSDELTKWKRGRRAEVRYRPSAVSAPIVFDVSLMGVTAAFRYAESSAQ
ncbi:invasion associated locus B family protein [Roseovarius pelagicus]|uniref:Invasion associated locus B family protein n=2 Tax=Roseovarius pelagicus TaxID=2980108 RepID=A0ABY6DIL1_9RHOB|nr:invasion associated locus B family protein [Roseovarius pelagicus]